MSDKISLRASAISCDAQPPYTELLYDSELPGPSSALPSPPPPPFSSLYFPSSGSQDHFKATVTEPDPPPAFCSGPSVEPVYTGATSVEAETKAALPVDSKGESSGKAGEEGEPPPPYTEGSSPLDSFTYVMAATSGPASIITQVQQGGGPPAATLAGTFQALHMKQEIWTVIDGTIQMWAWMST